MMIGVNSYSFDKLLRSRQMALKDVISKSKEMGFDCVEFTGFEAPEGKTRLEFAAELKEEADRCGIPIVNYAVSADFLCGSNGSLDAEIARVKGEVDIAEVLGATCFRHDCSFGRFPDNWLGARTFDNALPRLAAGCRAVTQYAAAKGIKTMIENHGQFSQESTRVERLISSVNHANFGVLLDIGNFTCADENPVLAVGRLAPFAFHCHVKDFHKKSGMEAAPGKGWFQSRCGDYLRGAIVGHGNVPVPQCIRKLLSSGYDGVFSIEFEGMEDVLTAIAYGLENLKRFIAMAKA